MFIPSLISIVLITIFVIYTRYRRRFHYSEQSSWNISDSSSQEWPQRPLDMPSEKNKMGIYLDRISFIEDTQISLDKDVLKIVRIAGEDMSSLPLYTTVHSDEEHFLTVIHISFHAEDKSVYMDILSLDKDFALKDNNQFSLLYVNGTQWNFAFTGKQTDEYAASIPLTIEQLVYLSAHPLDKWRLRRDKDDYFTVGNFNFDIRKYIYKPELQATIQIMASKLVKSLHNN